jgi:hypothetical protein
MMQRGRPKQTREVPESLQHASPEAQALGMKKHALNILVTEYDFQRLDALAFFESGLDGPKITVSDIVRRVIDNELTTFDIEHDGILEQYAVRKLEFEASELAIRASAVLNQSTETNL